jgi:membrane protein DedA with SNARE-associated domain
MAGCFMLYTVGRKGGEAFLRRRFKGHHVDRALAAFQKYGLLAIAVPALLPPPFPFKPFVLVAGVARVRPVDFLIAIGIGRGIRYFGEGLLAMWYGEQAAVFLRNNAREASLALAAVVLIGGLAWIWYGKRRASQQIDEGPPKPL